ncbi:MAG: outer membrane protein transport protein [Nannocystaceae bacterium]|nr:outer membrane protein transport protein [Nannocystaceae bacterium]
MRRALPCLAPLCLALPLVAAPASARASGFDAPLIGSGQSGPVTDDAAATWWNPGRLGTLRQPELQVGAGLVFGAIGYQRDLRGQYQFSDNLGFKTPIDPADIDPMKFGQQQKVRATPVGPALDLYAAIPAIPDRLVFGVGVGIPYVALLGFPKDGPQRFAGQSIFLAAPHTTLAMAVRAHRVISIGAGVSYVLGTLSLSKIQDFGAVDLFGDSLSRPPIGQANDFGANAPPQVRELDVLARPIEIKQAIAHGISFNAGIALQPTDKLSLGLVYHHGANLTFHGKFRLDMNDEFFTQDLAAQGLQYKPLVTGKTTVRLRLPKRITLGAGYRISKRFGLDGFVSYVFYQDFDRIRIRLSSPDLAQPGLGLGPDNDQNLIRNWKGTVNTEINGRIEATEKLRVSVTVGYNSPASPDSTLDVFSPDGHRMIVGAGIRHRFSPRFALLADVKTQFIVPRTNTKSDYDLGNGRYTMFIGAAMVHGQFRFGTPGGKRAKAKAKATPSRPPSTAPQPDAAADDPAATQPPASEAAPASDAPASRGGPGVGGPTPPPPPPVPEPGH